MQSEGPLHILVEENLFLIQGTTRTAFSMDILLRPLFSRSRDRARAEVPTFARTHGAELLSGFEVYDLWFLQQRVMSESFTGDCLGAVISDLGGLNPDWASTLSSVKTIAAQIFKYFANLCSSGPEAVRSIQLGSKESIISLLREGSVVLSGPNAVATNLFRPSTSTYPQLVKALPFLLLSAVWGDENAFEVSTQTVLKLWAACAPSEDTSIVVAAHLAWAKLFSTVKAAFLSGTPLSAEELEALAWWMQFVVEQGAFDVTDVELCPSTGLMEFVCGSFESPELAKLLKANPLTLWPELPGCARPGGGSSDLQVPFILSVLATLTSYPPVSLQVERCERTRDLLWLYWARHMQIMVSSLITLPTLVMQGTWIDRRFVRNCAKAHAEDSDMRSLGFKTFLSLLIVARDDVVCALTQKNSVAGDSPSATASTLLCNLADEVSQHGPNGRLALSSLCSLLVDEGTLDMRWDLQCEALVSVVNSLSVLIQSDGAAEGWKLDASVALSVLIEAIPRWCNKQKKPARELPAWGAIVHEEKMYLLAFASNTLTGLPDETEWLNLYCLSSRAAVIESLQRIVIAFIRFHGVTIAHHVITKLPTSTATVVEQVLRQLRLWRKCKVGAMELAKLTLLLGLMREVR